MIGLGNHPWMNGLFGDDETTQIFAPEAELKRFLQVEAAWTRALGQVHDAPQADGVAKAIQTANINPCDLNDGFATDGVPVLVLVKLLKSKIGPELGDWIHSGLTSQDVMDTALVLALKDVLSVFSKRLKTLDRKLGTLQSSVGSAQIMAYTRLQPALQTSAVEVVRRWRQPLPRLMDDLQKVAETSAIIQWGGPIGMRDHPKADQLATAFAKQLGLQDPGQAWHTDRAVITDIAQLMARITTLTGKIGEDVALMAVIGPQQITLSGGGSSAMPHKNNPVKAEALIALSDFAATLLTNLTRSARHEGFRSGQAWMLEGLTLPNLCVTTGAGLIQTSSLLASIKRLASNHL